MGTSASWETMYKDERTSWLWPPAFDPESSPAGVEAVISHLAVQRGARLLDLACGLGWLTVPLAQRGFQVTGLDLSAALLSLAEKAANEAGVEVDWVRGDMRALPEAWAGRFDAVSLTLSEFGCFDDPSDNQKVLSEVARVLKPGGRFLLDVVVNRDGLVVRGDTRDCLEGDGFILSVKGTLDLLTGIHSRRFRWYHQGELQEADWQIHAYTPPDIARMLAQVGLQVVATHANLYGDELRRDSTGMTFVAKK